MNLAATSFVHEGTGSAFAHLVTYSTAVIMYLAPVLFPCFGNGPIKYISYNLHKMNLQNYSEQTTKIFTKSSSIYYPYVYQILDLEHSPKTLRSEIGKMTSF